jgi:hypothetical protein
MTRDSSYLNGNPRHSNSDSISLEFSYHVLKSPLSERMPKELNDALSESQIISLLTKFISLKQNLFLSVFMSYGVPFLFVSP